jgi:DNA anti-recombination protein RmuC
VAFEVEAIQKSLGEISERLEKLEKPEGEATEKSAEIQAIEKSLAEIGTRLEKVEKARGVSQKGEPEPETAAAPKGPMTGQVSPRVKHFGC